MTGRERAGEKMKRDLLAVGFIGLGVLLVVTPAFASTLAAPYQPSESHTYQAVEVTPIDRSVEFESGSMRAHDLNGIDCTEWPDRLCGMERALLLDNGTVETDVGVIPTRPRFVWLERELYERVRNSRERGDELGLAPVSGENVLENVSVDVEFVDDESAVRRIVSQGNATLDEQLSEPGTVVAIEDEYYVFDRRQSDSPSNVGLDWRSILIAGVGLVAGLWMLRRGWKLYDVAREL